MKEFIKSAVTLSIISSPARHGLWNNITLPPGQLLKNLGPEELKTQEIIAWKYSLNPFRAADRIIERCCDKKIKIVTIWDREYPELLKQIHNPPLVLYVRGKIPCGRMISIVGTRDSDPKAEEITRKISSAAAAAGYTVVSGMAMGIDRNAHLGAINSGGSTVAVLPGGVDIVYPGSNSDIYRMITESDNSAVISEYPPGTGTGQKWTFARRNRLISGISESVLLVQAPMKSGAMITARYAIEQNRELYVCPGNAFDEKYSGCHQLIKEGAAVFSDMGDLFPANDRYSISVSVPVDDKGNFVKAVNKKEADLDHTTDVPEVPLNHGRNLYEDLKNGIPEIDKYIRMNNFSVYEVNQAITVLEIEGVIERIGNRVYKI